MKFTHLHVHSHYSLLDGLPKIDELLNYVKELGQDAVALTDHGVIYGAVEFYKKAKEKGIKPILGCEMYLSYEGMEQKRPNIDDRRYHLVLLVKNEKGYKNLVKLITKAHLEGFYYKPRIDENLLAEYSEGLIGLSACLQGKISQLILSKKIDEAEKTALKYKEIFGEDNFYLELQSHPNIPEQKRANKELILLSKKLKIPLVATNDSHYLKPEDAEAQDILMLINTGAKPDDPERLTMNADDFSLRSAEKMLEDFEDTPQAIENTQKIVEDCNFNFKLGEVKLPSFEVPENIPADEYLKQLCEYGLEKRYPQKSPEVKERLEYELAVIQKTGFAPYFLIVQDFVNWAKENRIVVGPGRGSSAGSIVSYLLNITDVDPLKHDLLFERFLNKDRISMPDIDLDFTDRRRDEVINYVAEKYGRDRVAQIITFGTMASRAVIRDVGRAMKLSYNFCDQLAKMIPFGFTLDECLKKVSEFRQVYETDAQAKKLIDLSKKLEGCARHASTHACGIVISKEPLTELVPLQHPTQSDKNIVTQYEMHAIEDLGLLKMDFLGLKNLTIIEDALNRIYVVQGKKIDISQIPFDDKKTYKLLQEGKSTGIFQLESEGIKRYLRELKPTCFDDIVAIVALYRPGPIQFIPDYIARKNKKKAVEYLHPKLKPILEKTQGICVYQEQLMRIARDLAGFTLSEADVLRKAVGKKIPQLLREQKERFIEGTIKTGVGKQIGEKIWEWILPFASYGFPKSHSVAYATIAYYTAFLKAHFPVEFMSSLLTSEKADIERIAFLIGECKEMGIGVLPPEINESFRNFSVVPGKNKIRFGLLAIKNVGSNVVTAIVKEREAGGPFSSISDFVTRISCKDLNKKSMESLIKTGVFDRLAERSQLLFNLDRLLDWSRETQRMKLIGQRGLFDGAKFNNKEVTLSPTQPASKTDRILWEKELLGLFVTANPLEDFKKVLEKKAISIAKINNDISGSDSHYSPDENKTKTSTKFDSHFSRPFSKEMNNGKKIRIGGIITNIKKILTKTGKPMLFLKVEDLTDKIEVIVFPSIIETNPIVFQENKIVFVSGRVHTRDGVPKIIAEEIEEIVSKD